MLPDLHYSYHTTENTDTYITMPTHNMPTVNLEQTCKQVQNWEQLQHLYQPKTKVYMNV